MGSNNNSKKDTDRSSTNTSCFVQILGVGNDTATSTPSALLFFDRQRYLFNAGEGFQRFCVEHRLKLARVSAVFSTRVTTDATGGLPGMLLTMADTSCGGLLTGHSGIVLHGPPGINTLVNAFRTFINTKDMGFKVQEFGRGMAPSDIAAANALAPVVKNDLVTITPVVLHSSAGDSAVAEAGAEPDAKRQRVNGHPPPPSSSSPNQGAPPPSSSMYSQSITVPSTTKDNPVACYVIKLPDIPGKFLIQKAAALGVPRGPLYGKLVKGESVVAMNGQTVTPDQVMEPSVPGPLVLMVDCPDEHFVQALTSAPAFKNLVSSSSSAAAEGGEGGEDAAKIACVVHFGPKAVTDLPAYKEWMAGLGEETTHILAAEAQGQVPPVLRKSTELQTRLNMIDPGLFKLPVSATAVMESAIIGKHNPGHEISKNCIIGDNMLRYNIRPLAKKGVSVDDVPEPLDLNKIQSDLRQQKPEVIQLAEEAASLIPSVLSNNNNEGEYGIMPPEVAAVVNHGTTSSSSSSSLPINDIKLTFLGTGAAVPSKYRNVTGLFADLGGDKGTLMMDCGEGSYSQLCRRFGKHQADEYIKALRCIWISHIHADHHVGLPTLLSTRCRLLGAGAPPLLVVGPRPLRRALHAYGQVEPLNAQFVDSIYTTAEFGGGGDGINGTATDGTATTSTGPRPPPPPEGALEAINQVKASLGLSRLESIRVIHCAHSYGLILESSQEPRWKLVLSGDTRPCPALNQAAQGATIFIHEATFEDGLDEEADAKKHCCVKDALHAGVVSGAYRTILTHFSQRYPKIPVLKEDNLKNKKIGLAYDMMTVGLGDLPRLPCVIPALQGLCDEDDEEEEGEEGGGEGQAGVVVA